MSRPKTAQERYRAAMDQAKKNQQKRGRTAMPKQLKFPDVSDRDDRITAIRERMAEVYDAAVAEQNRRNRMDATPSVDGRRFPEAVKGVKA